MSGYNKGQYDFQQQVFCMSMLTCLSFNITGDEEKLLHNTKTAIDIMLRDDKVRQLIGNWEIVWGPAIFADSFRGSKASVNYMFMAAPEEHPDQVVIAIAGTNGISMVDWKLQDFNVKELVEWRYGSSPLNPKLSKGIDFGLDKLVIMKAEGPAQHTAISARDYLSINPSITKIMVTGHSLGGALSAAYALYLDDTCSSWDTGPAKEISCLSTAGQTPGNEGFSKYYETKLASTTTRVWNLMDIVPHGFNTKTLNLVPTMYEPEILAKNAVRNMVNKIHEDVKDHQYANILPDAEGFESTYIEIESLAGRFAFFVKFIKHVVDLLEKVLTFTPRDLLGTSQFLLQALIQHVIPYLVHFDIEEFAKQMFQPSVQKALRHSHLVPLGDRLKSWFTSSNDAPSVACQLQEEAGNDPKT